MNITHVTHHVSADTTQLRATPDFVNRQHANREPSIEAEQKVDKDKVSATVEQMNEFIKLSNTNLKFVFHDELSEYYVTVIDTETNEVLREIPPKKMLDMYSAMIKYIGILVDKKV